ncbi:MAG TPA: 16S rRNA (guanine(966)-N(2))-methyltransferase RsmD [Gaiellaceae bacterium]|nr:16S rRNA (guanine(966)-N(2))-methyltransferase RsmD [Gaiellaceae bacterium]
MRIIAGSRKGRRIAAPPGLDTRPTGDRVREAVFNLVGPLDGARVLDLYAGSGAMGLEALSRGAEHATFVERDRVAAATIAKNAETLGLADAVTLRREDVRRVLAADASAGTLYDLVLVDPPYRMLPGLLPDLSRLVPPVVAADGLVVVESEAREEPELPLPARTSRRYGSVRVTVFEAA